MEEAAGSSDKEMETIRQSLSFKINNLKETWVNVAQQLVDRGDLGKIIDFLSTMSNMVDKLVGNLGLLKTAALGIATVLSVKNVGRDKMCSLNSFIV